MTTHGDRADGIFRALDDAECWERLASKKVGRIAWCGADGPQLLPVNYTVDEHAIYFRTRGDSPVAKSLYESTALFEVDDVDELLETGWSVLARGEATYISNRGDRPRGPGREPEPWAPGPHEVYIRFVVRGVSGRQVIG